jgi:threonine synthase
MSNRYFQGLKCQCCDKPSKGRNFVACEIEMGPFQATYDYEAIRQDLTHAKIANRERNMWRYRELLPINETPTVGLNTGYTPLINAPQLAKALGVKSVHIKNDAANFPTLSFKDRVVSVALNKAKELGFKTVGCSSTGNLAGSVAALATEAGLESYVLIPEGLETGKIIGAQIYNTNVVQVKGTYDSVSRLCTEIAGHDEWNMGIVNGNLRPFYGEGSKTVAFEIAEQSNWQIPDHTIIPIASGSLLTKIDKGYIELQKVGLVPEKEYRIYGAQATGCNPVSAAFNSSKGDLIRPVKEPRTIANSLAIGNPADGSNAINVVRRTGGTIADVTDDEIRDGIRLLARTTSIFGETAAGVTVATAKKLIESGIIGKDQSIVICVTGNGLKTIEANELPAPPTIGANLKDFAEIVGQRSRERVLT